METVASVNLGSRRPEGVALDSESGSLFVSELVFGGIRKVNLFTGEVTQLVDSSRFASGEAFQQRAAGGMHYAHGAIWAAGVGVPFGLPATLYVYDALTGADIVQCPIAGAGFINDVTESEGTVYATDSLVNVLWTFDVDAALAGECTVKGYTLPAHLFQGGDPFVDPAPFRSNGIVPYKMGVILGRLVGGLYIVTPSRTDNSTTVAELVSPFYSPESDGLYLLGDTLYAVESFSNSVGVFEIAQQCGPGVTAFRSGSIKSELFDTPTTLALFGDEFFIVNGRFDKVPLDPPVETSANFTETFNVVRVTKP